jgi:hypothetical protein
LSDATRHRKPFTVLGACLSNGPCRRSVYSIVGLGILSGALCPNKRDFSLVCAFVVATAALILFGGRLMAPFGDPTRLQLWFSFGSIAIEVILFRLVLPRYRRRGERQARLVSLFKVGLHFLPMAVAFGPMCLALGLVLCLCSGAGLWLGPNLSLNALWAADGLVKIAFGSVMMLAL